jgi:HPt (histidine-containing phosphotransfer) domain-containing protein
LKGANIETPIIALSAAITTEDKKAYFGAGMNAVLGKPFRESELLEVISEHLQPQKEHVSGESNSLDFDGLKSLSGHDDKFYMEMLETFVRGTQNGIKEMQDRRAENNIKRVGEIAHRISSPCKHLEAVQLYEALKKIEKLAELEVPSMEEIDATLEQVSVLSSSIIALVVEELNSQKVN